MVLKKSKEGVVFMEFEKTIQLYLEYCMSKQLRKRSLNAYEQTLRLFGIWLRQEGIQEVEGIKDSTIRRYILNLQNRGKYTTSVDKKKELINYPERRTDYGKRISNLTINNYLRNLRGYFTWLVEMEYLEKNPMQKIRLLHYERTGKECLEDAEVKMLLEVLDKNIYSEYRDMVAAMVMLDSGMRLGEVLSMEREQLDLVQKTITLPAEKTKGRKARTVFFSQRTARELRHWIRYKEETCKSAYVFPVKRDGGKLSLHNYETNFRKYLRRTPITKHVSPHTLRNNFAKRCLMSGMDIYTLSRLLGHSSVTVTEKAYLDVKDHELKKRYVQHSPLERVYGK